MTAETIQMKIIQTFVPNVTNPEISNAKTADVFLFGGDAVTIISFRIKLQIIN